MSPELEILRAPRRAFARLAAESPPVSPLAASYRPIVVAVSVGTAASISSTGHVSVGQVLSLTACWMFVVAIQVVAALAVIPADSRRALGTPRTIDLFFSGHAAWTLWLLACAGWAMAVPADLRDVRWMQASIAIPTIWNAVIVFAFFRAALNLPRRAAAWRTIAHQAITLGSFLVIFGSAIAIWPRLIGMLSR